MAHDWKQTGFLGGVLSERQDRQDQKKFEQDTKLTDLSLKEQAMKVADLEYAQQERRAKSDAARLKAEAEIKNAPGKQAAVAAENDYNQYHYKNLQELEANDTELQPLFGATPENYSERYNLISPETKAALGLTGNWADDGPKVADRARMLINTGDHIRALDRMQQKAAAKNAQQSGKSTKSFAGQVHRTLTQDINNNARTFKNLDATKDLTNDSLGQFARDYTTISNMLIDDRMNAWRAANDGSQPPNTADIRMQVLDTMQNYIVDGGWMHPFSKAYDADGARLALRALMGNRPMAPAPPVTTNSDGTYSVPEPTDTESSAPINTSDVNDLVSMNQDVIDYYRNGEDAAKLRPYSDMQILNMYVANGGKLKGNTTPTNADFTPAPKYEPVNPVTRGGANRGGTYKAKSSKSVKGAYEWPTGGGVGRQREK